MCTSIVTSPRSSGTTGSRHPSRALARAFRTVTDRVGTPRFRPDRAARANEAQGRCGRGTAYGMQPLSTTGGSDTGGSLRNPASFNNMVGATAARCL